MADNEAIPEGAVEAPPSAPLRPLRVAWLAGEQTLERYSRILQPLAIGLLDELIDLTAICPERVDTRLLPSPPMQILTHGRLNWWGLWSRKLQDIAERVSENDVQLLHALDSSAADLTQRLAAMLNVPYIVSSYELDDGRRLGHAERAAAAVLAASGDILKNLRRHHVTDSERVHLVRPGVYQVKHATCFIEPQYSITVVAGGALDDYAALAAVIRSFAELAGRKYDCAFFIMGNGRYERPLRSLADKLVLRHQLTFADALPTAQLPGIFKAADIFITPSPPRRLDVQALLAMAAGVPVLSASEGAGDFLRDGQTAMLYRKGDALELTAKLMGLLEDRASARSLAENALAYLREHHSPAHMVGELAKIYRDALATKK